MYGDQENMKSSLVCAGGELDFALRLTNEQKGAAVACGDPESSLMCAGG